ncbi:MAG: hypothetical protein R6U56_05290 [Opitutales bacterium]
MLGTRQQTWTVVDIGGRWIKCARYVVKRGEVREAGSQVIDIHAEGLLSAEEVATAIGRVLRSAGDHPLAVVLPQGSAVSQVMDLPRLSADERSGEFEAEVLELIGLSAERCVYDSHPLPAFGGYTNPQWITVAKEENLSRQISPLLGQGLRVEAATTVGNALLASFRQAHPEVEEACLVDIGATQTTVVRLKQGGPAQMTSLVDGGENWTEALVEPSGEAFEEVEARLFREDLFSDPALGAVLHAVVGAWRDRLIRQIEEWQGEFGMAEEGGAGPKEIYLFGGYAAISGLRGALTQAGGLSWHIPEKSREGAAPVWTPAYGAVLMAAGISGLKASILPRSLAKMRQRRLTLSRLKTGVLYLYVLLAIVLGGAIFKQQGRLDGLTAANRQAEAILAEIEASNDLLEQRDALAERIEPIVRGQLNSLASLESFRRVQRVHREFDFTLIRFTDRRTYFRETDGQSEAAESTEAGASDQTPDAPDQRAEARPQAFVVELAVRGGQAERLQALSDIAGRLREEKYFANVDRLVDGPGPSSAANERLGEGEAYALLLTLAGDPPPVADGPKKGAGR